MIPAGPLRGIVAMICAMSMFITNDVLIKLALAELPMGEIISLRSAAGALVLLVVIIAMGDGRAILLAGQRRVALRSGLDGVTTFTYVLALSVLPISTSTTIYMAAPLLTTALAVPLLGESVSGRRWIAILVGFSGALIVTRPSPSTFDVFALLPLLAAFCGSLRDISTRGISMVVPGTVVAFSTAVCLALASAVFALWETWRVPDLFPALCILGSGLTFALGNILMVFAFRNAPVAAISPLRYVLVPFSLFYGYVIFNHLPDMWGVAGTILVVGAGLYSIRQEAMRGQQEARARAAAAAIAPSGAPLSAPVTCSPPRS
ncbi:DMT family transporter [Aquabacter cavernae]|uniref:DMT family transporter n=1 Tax=Aquabacter cavernae TaxID=2496029 RepID=UPI000F8D3C45|nr:DMT family transporter [Aquabacter cavernae]